TEVEVEAVGEDDPEPYTDGRLDIGKVVYEVLVSAIAPFARKPGAELEQEDTDGAQVATGPISNNPFAVLSRLKRPPGDSV
ncbi:MAG TPA: hypothetical protein VMX97_17805, partial [Hyphomicrobiaceae bacterium]|nr:hypothetical protein [Hyphomicrobiaceae bacterium]